MYNKAPPSHLGSPTQLFPSSPSIKVPLLENIRKTLEEKWNSEIRREV
jgi:hypothetical protein